MMYILEVNTKGMDWSTVSRFVDIDDALSELNKWQRAGLLVRIRAEGRLPRLVRT